MRGRLRRVLVWLVLLAAFGATAGAAAAQRGEGEITLQAQYAVDESGDAGVDSVAAGALAWKPMDRHRSFQLGSGALWMKFDLPQRDASHRWYLMLTGAAFFDRASLFVRGPDGRWQEQRAGDHLAVAQWDHPNFAPLFAVPAEGAAVWLRLENGPASASPFVQMLTGESLQMSQQWTFLLLGGYLGFGLLVLLVGLMHGRLYREVVFDVYCVYVACMLLFQLAFTGIGGLFFWPESAWFNDAAPAMFMLLMAGSGIWNIRESTALQRHSRVLDRVVMGFAAFGLVFPVFYAIFHGPFVYAVLNLYALSSVVISIGVCLWTWRKGERYSKWLFFGFLPVHLAYPFPALRAAGVLPDGWATQYAVLIGSAIEIPLLLWILHARARDFSENQARLRALDSTDPLTGLTVAPVLRLRLRDALRRAQRMEHRCAVLLVELSNHGEILSLAGREAADRALVIAGSRLSSVVREVDTVCRIADARFAVLMEGPQPEDSRRSLAQHIVARGLEPVHQLPPDVPLRFRVVSAWVPDGAIELTSEGATSEQVLLERLEWALQRLLEDPRRVVHHLEHREGPSGAESTASA